jgi:hypothetical protein
VVWCIVCVVCCVYLLYEGVDVCVVFVCDVNVCMNVIKFI